MKFADGFIIVIENNLSGGMYIDDVYVGTIQLQNIDQFLRLRSYLEDVDLVAVLTVEEAKDAQVENVA